ncbi:TPA: SDR family oxidoreductase [Enterococcus faecium]|nr:SDR family oxidoreductase [Enterococcus faecium]
MAIKSYIKRLLLYIRHGDPKINLDVSYLSEGAMLAGKTVIITGGAKGLGFAIAKSFIAQGASVIITGRDMDSLNNAKCQLGDMCSIRAFDITDAKMYRTFFEDAYETFGRIDILLNNAGISLHEDGFMSVTEKTWDKQMDTNLKGVYFFTQEFIKFVKEKNQMQANIIMMSSERGLCGDSIPYGLSKAAINSLVVALSKKYISEGIRVNGIAPGVTATAMTGISEKGNLYNPATIGYRYFLPEEVAQVALFLASSLSNCISGEIIACDQGQYLSRNWG